MNGHGLYLVVLLSVIVTFTVIPAYAEVTSLKTNAPFYKGGNKIYFSGTILDTDPPNVTILIFDPTNKFILLTSGVADNNHQFQIAVDTTIPDNQQKFSLKGVYNATAFIANKENGKTVDFVFSPDGSPIAPFPPTSLTASATSSTEIDLNWSGPINTGGSQLYGYKIERDNGSGFNPIQNVQSTSYQDKGLAPNKLYSYRVSAVNQAGTSAPSSVAAAVTLSPSAPIAPVVQTPNSTDNPSSTLSLDELLKQRLADAKRLQELLNGKTPSSPATGSVQTIQITENMILDDMSTNLVTQKSTDTSRNNLTPSDFVSFDVRNVLYPAISLVGVGIVVTILYLKKKRKLSSGTVEIKKEMPAPTDVSSEQLDDDYAMMILKNRLAKGEITIDEFKALKEELSEP